MKKTTTKPSLSKVGIKNQGNSLIIVFFVLLVFAAGTGYFYWQNQSRTTPEKVSNTKVVSTNNLTPTASFQTKKGTVNLFFQSPNYPVRKTSDKAFSGDTFTGQRYILDGSPIRSFYIDYYSSVELLKTKTDFMKDGDENNPGRGCTTTTDNVNVNGVNLQKVICYYNGVPGTKAGESGKYMPDISTITGTECIYWIDKNNTEALYFWGLAQEGHDTCQYLQQELKDFKVELKP